MKILDLVAILGALAWLPHLISFFKSLLTKPQVRIITQKKVDIGYTTYGPIFNIRIAFAVKNHDLVLSNFRTKIIHESGEEKYFNWQGIRQQVLRMNTAEASIPYEKENTVLALKLNQKDIEERFIQCQNEDFLQEKQRLENLVARKYSFERSQNKEYEAANLTTTQEASDLINYIKQSFSWKSGKYKVIFELESPERFELIGNEYNFELTMLDIERLEQNKENIEQDYINMIAPAEHERRKDVFWNWTYPKLTDET